MDCFYFVYRSKMKTVIFKDEFTFDFISIYQVSDSSRHLTDQLVSEVIFSTQKLLSNIRLIIEFLFVN